MKRGLTGRRSGEPFDGRNTVVNTRMRGKESAAPTAGNTPNPGKRIEHGLFRVARTTQNVHAVAIGSIFFGSTIAARHQLAGNRGQYARCWKQLLEQGSADI